MPEVLKEKAEVKVNYNNLLQAVPNHANPEELRLYYVLEDGHTLMADSLKFDAFQYSAKLPMPRPIRKLSHSPKNGTA